MDNEKTLKKKLEIALKALQKISESVDQWRGENFNPGQFAHQTITKIDRLDRSGNG